MRFYLRTLALFYAVGAGLHLADLLDLRLLFSEMTTIWRFWVVFLLIGDSLAAIGLWCGKYWGQVFFVGIAVSQLVAYLGFPGVFGDQRELIAFHFVALGIYAFLQRRERQSAGSIDL